MEQPDHSASFQSWNQFRYRFMMLLVLILIILLLWRSCDGPAPAPEDPSLTLTELPPTATFTVTPSETPAPSSTPAPPDLRPLFVLDSYSTMPQSLISQQEFVINLQFFNQSLAIAKNAYIDFATDTFTETRSGEEPAVNEIPSFETHEFSTELIYGSEIVGVVALQVDLMYSDIDGRAYHQSFTIYLNFLKTDTPTPTPADSPTVTPRPCNRYGEDRGTYWLVSDCDTLSRISQITGISLERLLSANPEITNPDLIYPNQSIWLPGR